VSARLHSRSEQARHKGLADAALSADYADNFFNIAELTARNAQIFFRAL
jgi:hypothetical protein